MADLRRYPFRSMREYDKMMDEMDRRFWELLGDSNHNDFSLLLVFNTD